MSGAADPRGCPAFEEIEQAREILSRVLSPTPVLAAPAFSVSGGREVVLKAENLQRTGSFKIRGAYNRISRLSGSRGVIAASAGNHAQGVGLAARMAGLPATIVMPVETPLIKVDRTRALGAEVILHGSSYEEAYRKASDLQGERGLTFVHAYEDRDVIAGQGTTGLEILEARPDTDLVVVPVGGGGLISGIALAVKTIAPATRVVGVQARGAAPAVRAYRGEHDVEIASPVTIADAIRFKKASGVTIPILRTHVDDMVEVDEEEISEAIVRLMEESKIVAEGAGAVGLAALLSGRLPESRVTCLVVSGGNIDLNMASRVLEQGLAKSNRFLVLRCPIVDKPGRLLAILTHMADQHVNVLDVHHYRAGWKVPLGLVEVEMLVETRNAEHADEIIRSLEAAGYEVSRSARGK